MQYFHKLLEEIIERYSMEHDGRLRKYYHITEAGRKRLADFKEEWKEIMSVYQFVAREEREHD